MRGDGSAAVIGRIKSRRPGWIEQGEWSDPAEVPSHLLVGVVELTGLSVQWVVHGGDGWGHRYPGSL